MYGCLMWLTLYMLIGVSLLNRKVAAFIKLSALCTIRLRTVRISMYVLYVLYVCMYALYIYVFLVSMHLFVYLCMSLCM